MDKADKWLLAIMFSSWALILVAGFTNWIID